jgi:hypothetical protein
MRTEPHSAGLPHPSQDLVVMLFKHGWSRRPRELLCATASLWPHLDFQPIGPTALSVDFETSRASRPVRLAPSPEGLPRGRCILTASRHAAPRGAQMERVAVYEMRVRLVAVPDRSGREVAAAASESQGPAAGGVQQARGARVGEPRGGAGERRHAGPAAVGQGGSVRCVLLLPTGSAGAPRTVGAADRWLFLFLSHQGSPPAISVQAGGVPCPPLPRQRGGFSRGRQV